MAGHFLQELEYINIMSPVQTRNRGTRAKPLTGLRRRCLLGLIVGGRKRQQRCDVHGQCGNDYAGEMMAWDLQVDLAQVLFIPGQSIMVKAQRTQRRKMKAASLRIPELVAAATRGRDAILASRGVRWGMGCQLDHLEAHAGYLLLLFLSVVMFWTGILAVTERSRGGTAAKAPAAMTTSHGN